MLKHKISANHHIGSRDNQEDFYGVHEIPDLGTLCIVCDGMGGAKGGALASERATKIIIQNLSEAYVLNPRDALENAIIFANRQIFEYAERNPTYKGMGTTITAVLFHRDYAIACHVGDSRIYQLRAGNKAYRSNDHSKVFEKFVLTGQKTEEEARNYPEKNVITRALGIAAQVNIETQILPYLKNDRFILCTDGVWESMTEELLLQFFKVQLDPELVTNGLIQNILDQNNSRQDNMTLMVIDLKSNSKIEPPLNMRTKTLIGVLAVLAIATLPLAYRVIVSTSREETLQGQLKHSKKDLAKREVEISNLNKKIAVLEAKSQPVIIKIQPKPPVVYCPSPSFVHED